MKNHVVMSVLMSAALLSGCGGDDNETGQISNQTELEGTWSDTCEDWGDGTSSKGSLTFSGKTFSFFGRDYSDSVCSEVESTYSASGTFDIGNTMTTSSGLSAKEIDITTLKEDGQNVNDKGYDIFWIDGRSLYLGLNTDEKDGESAAARPIDLDFSFSYTKN